ncbi:ABC transporter ATP-binding protein/permease [Novosphingobium decolorationis]|uniref:ATP-binding cassette domain-containing protein n=1 Tax=Novosphingobium decolorationis TaxID=2698673 RepID=A0ABX8E5W9_9SPHN|nr:ATP-binding cassette domain-containing protein [Novosphingobium decolorationis]QVM84602.1 ATP-binding cassette domain-containing protein [Novosphingobium decolorationis]
MKPKRAGQFCALDILGAALFSWGISGGVEALVAGTALFGWLVCLAGGALLRASSVLLVHHFAMPGAQIGANLWRRAAMSRLLGGRLPAPVSAGTSAALAIDHVQAIEEHGARFQPARVSAVVGPLLAIGLIALASWFSALILLATLLPFVVGMIFAGTAARRASERQLDALAALSGLFVDRVRHLPLIRHYGAQARIARQVEDATHGVATRTVAVLRAAFLSSAVLEFFAAIAVALVAIYCGFALLGLLPFTPPEPLTLGRAFFALAMAPEVYLPMRRLAAAYHEKQMGEAAESALAEYAPGQDEVEEASSTPTAAPSPFDGLVVEGLILTWPTVCIGPVDLRLPRTGIVALSGPSGSGKTSTLAAIAGQIEVPSGRITTLAGHPLDRADVAWAAQRPLLLPGSLRRNLALAAPEACDAAVLVAARRVGLGPLLEKRGGLDLVIDHKGSGLSGGERRRIGLARALLSGRPLLLCDEPTADLDAASAAQIVAVLQELSRERALLVATHDETVRAIAQQEIAL